MKIRTLTLRHLWAVVLIAFIPLLMSTSSGRPRPSVPTPTIDKHAWLDVQRGKVLEQEGDLQGAMSLYQAGMDSGQGTEAYWDAGFALAALHARLEEHDQAVSLLDGMRQHLEDSPNSNALLCTMGAAYRSAKAYPESVDCYLQTLSETLSPDEDAEIRHDLATTYIHQKEYGQAIDQYVIIKNNNLSPEWNSFCDDLTAYIFLVSGDPQTAASWYQSIIDNYPDQYERCAGSQYLVGRCHAAMANEGAAMQAYEQVLNDYPGSEWVPLAQRRLDKTTEYSGCGEVQ